MRYLCSQLRVNCRCLRGLLVLLKKCPTSRRCQRNAFIRQGTWTRRLTRSCRSKPTRFSGSGLSGPADYTDCGPPRKQPPWGACQFLHPFGLASVQMQHRKIWGQSFGGLSIIDRRLFAYYARTLRSCKVLFRRNVHLEWPHRSS